ncbi:MAG: glycogen synthase GlgA [Opitutales bacterium]
MSPAEPADERPLRILNVSPEVAPYAKMGGLGDMVGALTKALDREGADVRTLCPLYGSIRREADWTSGEDPLFVHLGYGQEDYARVWETRYPHSQAPMYFLEFNKYFQRPEIYTGPWGAHGDNGARFAFFSKAALELCRWLDWQPDVIHAHDWTTGLIPVFLNTSDLHTPLGRCASIFTIHNLQHQGIFPREVLDWAGLPPEVFRPDDLESVGFANYLKGGLYNATKITTVSPHYAEEIKTPAYGCGLDSVVRFRAADLIGVLNGVDYETWNPATDPHLPANYSREDLSGKAHCKRALQERLGLTVDPSVPVYGVVSRLYDQKGLDWLATITPWIMAEMSVQIVVLGAGEPALEANFQALATRYPGRVGCFIGYSEALAHLVEAGSDFFVMPSRFEPCGLNQMYSLAYGTLPIVRATGGLVDTVRNYDEATGEGTGFIFEQPDERALYYTIGWACSTWYDRPAHYRQLQQRAMAEDFSWGRSAKRYLQIYQWARDARLEGLGLIKKQVAAQHERRVLKTMIQPKPDAVSETSVPPRAAAG